MLLEEPSLIEDHLIRWTKLHHHQANESPSLHSDYGISQQPRQVPATEVEYQEWLEVILNYKKQMGKINVELGDYKKYIKNKPEKKRTSPSGLHLGIYKTLP